MKKITSFIVAALVSSMLFAASFKVGTTVYVSKNTNATESEKSSKVVEKLSKGDFGVVVTSTSKKTEIKLNSSGKKVWIDNKDLTKKKIVSSTVSTNLDNIALSGKGKKSAKSTPVETVTESAPVESAKSEVTTSVESTESSPQN